MCLVGWCNLFVSGEWAAVSLYFRSVAPPGIHTKALLQSPPPLFSLPCLWVTSMHHFRGRGGKRQINKISFQSLYSQRELDEGAAGRWEGGVGGLRPAIENCCPYPERSVYTTCKVKQIDPGCRFTCVFVRLPVNLPACHLQSLFLIRTPPPPPLSPFSFHTCAYVCISVFVCITVCMFHMFPCCVFPRGCQAWIQRSIWENLWLTWSSIWNRSQTGGYSASPFSLVTAVLPRISTWTQYHRQVAWCSCTKSFKVLKNLKSKSSLSVLVKWLFSGVSWSHPSHSCMVTALYHNVTVFLI